MPTRARRAKELGIHEDQLPPKGWPIPHGRQAIQTCINCRTPFRDGVQYFYGEVGPFCLTCSGRIGAAMER